MSSCPAGTKLASNHSLVSEVIQMVCFIGHESKKNIKTKGMFQNLAFRTKYELEIIIFIPFID